MTGSMLGTVWTESEKLSTGEKTETTAGTAWTESEKLSIGETTETTPGTVWTESEKLSIGEKTEEITPGLKIVDARGRTPVWEGLCSPSHCCVLSVCSNLQDVPLLQRPVSL